MTSPLTDQQLNDIEARHQAATPGPWGLYRFGGDTLIEIAADLEDTGTGYRARREICRLEDEPLDNDPTHKAWTAEEDWAQVQADATFIAHAREDVEALTDEIHRLRQQKRVLLAALARKDTAPEAADAAVSAFHAGEAPEPQDASERPSTALLRDVANYLSALHGSVARHDNLAANYGCAGCELRDKIRAQLATPAVPAAAAGDTRDRT